MYKKVTSQASLDLVTLQEAKIQCRLTSSMTMDDDYISSLITVCGELAQNYTNRLLSVGSVIMVWDCYYSKIKLWGGEIEVVDSLTAVDENGEVVTIDSTDYEFDEISQRLTVSSDYSLYTDFKASYVGGYSTDDLPNKVKQGVLLMLATMYNSREDYLVNQSVDKIPMSSTVVLNSVRDYYAP